MAQHALVRHAGPVQAEPHLLDAQALAVQLDLLDAIRGIADDEAVLAQLLDRHELNTTQAAGGGRGGGHHLMAGAGRSAPSLVPAYRWAVATRASTSSSLVSKAQAIRTTPSLGAPRREKL